MKWHISICLEWISYIYPKLNAVNLGPTQSRVQKPNKHSPDSQIPRSLQTWIFHLCNLLRSVNSFTLCLYRYKWVWDHKWMSGRWNVLELSWWLPLLPTKSLSRSLCSNIREVRKITFESDDLLVLPSQTVEYFCLPLQSMCLPSLKCSVPRTSPVHSLQIHEHPIWQVCAIRHLPDTGHNYLCQHY